MRKTGPAAPGEPHGADGWAERGARLLRLERPEEAVRACRRALGIDPRHRAARIHLAAGLFAMGQPTEAETICGGFLALDPGDLESRLLLAHGLVLKGDLVQALGLLQTALAQDPASPAARRMIQHVAIQLGHWPELRKVMERQLESCSGPKLEMERANIHLLFGEWSQGWERYESRLLDPALAPPGWQFTRPAWNGEPFPGRTVLLHWEQGLGDTLMFLRYAPRVKALGGNVVLVAQGELAELAATCPGVDQVIPHLGRLPPYDCHVSLLSLPRVFGTQPGTVPAEIPYLGLPERVPNRTALASALAASQGKTRVGLVWAGRPEHKKDHERSIPAGALAPLAALPGVAWHSFQLDPHQLAPLPGLLALAPWLSNFSDTAYALSGMDLVITVDTAMAHLAGAMGVPTLLLLPFLPDFRWLLERTDSPWYPTMRLYRQPQPGDWDAVIRKVLLDLGGPATGPGDA